MIVGQKILDQGLVVNGSRECLKNSTYDLTIGEIFPMGKVAAKKRAKGARSRVHYLEPREMIWVLSHEEFGMPLTVTGLATLRTSLTNQGLLALNVGIIDPGFAGPISTALINFSDRPRRIAVGDKFFRIVFVEHDDVKDFNKSPENTERVKYGNEIESFAYSDFSRNFLNVPDFDDDFYYKRFWLILWSGLTRNWYITLAVSFMLMTTVWFAVEDLKIHKFYCNKFFELKSILTNSTPTTPPAISPPVPQQGQ